MPELPEVAYYRKFADATALDKKVEKIVFGASRPLQQSEKSISQEIIGHKFTKTEQLGKYLFLDIDTGKCLVLHFGMSGSLDFAGGGHLPKHAIVSFFFSDDTHFSFVCPRKFGKVWIADSMKEFQKEHSLGPHALSISKKDFLDLIEQKSTGIKSVLMDQHNIAGIGNVYVDEILFQSEVHPQTKVAKLKDLEINRIYSNISKILKKATQIIENDSKVPDSWLKAHRKEGDPCPSCKGEIKKIQVGGRSTYFCPNCQVELSVQ